VVRWSSDAEGRWVIQSPGTLLAAARSDPSRADDAWLQLRGPQPPVGAHYVLGAPVSLAGADWGAATAGALLDGTLDGAGNAVLDLEADAGDGPGGLFPRTAEGSRVENLVVTNARVSGSPAGAVAGAAAGALERVSVTGAVVVRKNGGGAGDALTAGLVGELGDTGVVSDCRVDAQYLETGGAGMVADAAGDLAGVLVRASAGRVGIGTAAPAAGGLIGTLRAGAAVTDCLVDAPALVVGSASALAAGGLAACRRGPPA